MVRKDEPEKSADDDFMDCLERGVRAVLANRKSTATERLNAVNAGAKLMMIKFKISGADEDNFFR